MTTLPLVRYHYELRLARLLASWRNSKLTLIFHDIITFFTVVAGFFCKGCLLYFSHTVEKVRAWTANTNVPAYILQQLKPYGIRLPWRFSKKDDVPISVVLKAKPPPFCTCLLHALLQSVSQDYDKYCHLENVPIEGGGVYSDNEVNLEALLEQVLI